MSMQDSDIIPDGIKRELRYMHFGEVIEDYPDQLGAIQAVLEWMLLNMYVEDSGVRRDATTLFEGSLVMKWSTLAEAEELVRKANESR